jgi:hypothetical protein
VIIGNASTILAHMFLEHLGGNHVRKLVQIHIIVGLIGAVEVLVVCGALSDVELRFLAANRIYRIRNDLLTLAQTLQCVLVVTVGKDMEVLLVVGLGPFGLVEPVAHVETSAILLSHLS